MKLRLFRVLPWQSEARKGEAGHPLYIPGNQGSSRIDNPVNYRVLYASDNPVGAVAEAFARLWRWHPDMFASPRNPGVRRALVEYEADVRVVDLDEPRELFSRSLRPSRIASRDRSVTQAWALEIFSGSRGVDGIRWWSIRDSEWGVIGLWNVESLVFMPPTILTPEHPIVEQARVALGRPWQ